jgi:hypothetical protein
MILALYHDPKRIREEHKPVVFVSIITGVVGLWTTSNGLHTYEKENQIFLIYQEILKGTVAKSYILIIINNKHTS